MPAPLRDAAGEARAAAQDAGLRYIDDTVPRIPSLAFSSAGVPIRPEAVSGTVDVVAQAFDVSPLPIPPPWEQSIFAPALIRWRIVQGETTFWQWTNAVDFRRYLLPFTLFDFVYAPGTYQNRPHRRGRYEYYLAHELDTHVLPNGSYVLQVDALDEQDNMGQASLPFTVANAS